MASLITTEEKSILTGTFQDVFDTFKREIVIFKEPKQIVADVSESVIFGYDNPSNSTNYTYQPVSGSFYATVRYNDLQQEEFQPEMNMDISKGVVRIKVQKEAKDFIEKGKTDRIEFDEKTFDVVSEMAVKRFLNSEFFVYYLESTK
jgi:hypothetical protein